MGVMSMEKNIGWNVEMDFQGDHGMLILQRGMTYKVSSKELKKRD